MRDDGIFRDWKLSGRERVIRNGKFVLVNRRTWLPDAQRQIGMGMLDNGKEAVVYFLRDGKYQLISHDIVEFLTVPPERVFYSKWNAMYFCLFNHRCWYLVFENSVFYARYSK